MILWDSPAFLPVCVSKTLNVRCFKYNILLFRQNPIATLAVGKLLDEAKEYRAPFINTALERLHGNLFGTGRATRCTDVIIFNKLDRAFKLQADSCDDGSWTGTMFPEYEIPAQSSVVHGAESNSFLTGLWACKTTYQSQDADKVKFTVAVSNPYVGKNSATIVCPFSKIKPYIHMSEGVANTARFILDKPESDDPVAGEYSKMPV